jgi:hypothetical protein
MNFTGAKGAVTNFNFGGIVNLTVDILIPEISLDVLMQTIKGLAGRKPRVFPMYPGFSHEVDNTVCRQCRLNFEHNVEVRYRIVMPGSRTVPLFSYGTLQEKEVQMATFGRELTGREDALPGYTLGKVEIRDPAVVASRGETHYANILPSSDPNESVSGVVFDITEQELVAADKYEEDADYCRILVSLKSGDQAWVYLRV